MFCREWLAQLESHRAEIEEAGLKIVAIGIGQPKHARRYCGKLAPSLDCYTNEETDVYRAYGLKRGGLGQLMSPSVMRAGMRATSSGFQQGKSTGDVKMLPGTFIIDTDGAVQYAYYSRHAGDHPSISKLLQAMA